MKIVKDIFNNFMGELFPPICLVCENPVLGMGKFCPACWPLVNMLEQPLCPIAGVPLPYSSYEGLTSVAAFAKKRAFDRTCSVFLYDDIIRHLVHNFKFNDRPDLALWLARLMVYFLRRNVPELLAGDFLVVPVPLHKKRLRLRLFNQSAELAREFCKISQQNYCPNLLQRVRHTNRQMGLSRQKRLKNLTGAFIVPHESRVIIKGKRILLIDDVLTTGSTIEACSKALRRGGAKYIAAITIARVA